MTTANDPKKQPPPPPSARPAAEATDSADPSGEVERLRAELDAAHDRALRVAAELDNYRKRASRELQDERRYAQMPLMRDLAPVIDNLERALAAAEKDPASVAEGVRLVAQQLNGILDRHGCTRIKALGEPFDPNLHQAILQQPTADQPENTIVAVTQAGFQLHDRVVRPAQVIVAKKLTEPEPAARK